MLLKKTGKNLKWNLTEAQSTRFVLSPGVAQSLPSAAVASLQIDEFDSLSLLESLQVCLQTIYSQKVKSRFLHSLEGEKHFQFYIDRNTSQSNPK